MQKVRINLKIIILIFLIALFAGIGQTQQKDENSAGFPVLKGKYLGQKPPGDTPELFAPGIISTCNQHSSAVFTHDGKEVYFSQMFPHPAKIMFMKEINGRWTEPEVAPFSGKYNDLTPFISSDGNKIYFTSNRPIKKGAKPGWPSSDFWVVTRTEDGWLEPEFISIRIPGTIQQDGASVTDNGTFYFSGKPDKRTGRKSDIYRSLFQDGIYSEPERFSDEVNSEYVDGFSFIAPDESYIIFCSFRPGGYGMSDLYISFFRSDGTWTTPKNMGRKINSEAKDAFPYVTPDGKYFFFNSSRVSVLNDRKIPDGPGNIYWVDARIIEELKKEVLKY
ncbi:hypothetical protein ACFL4T_13515 [candidate division KSB1 bacterium]